MNREAAALIAREVLKGFNWNGLASNCPSTTDVIDLVIRAVIAGAEHLRRPLRGDYGVDENGEPRVGPSGSIYAQRSEG